MLTLLERYAQVEEKVSAACRKAGRVRDDVLLLAVSKFQPASAIRELAAAGQKDFGENYVQEALAKHAFLAQDARCRELRWHMTGHVQSRKAAQVAGMFTLIHTLDSKKLADGLERKLSGTGGFQNALIEVNIGAEPQKAGVMPGELTDLGQYVLTNCPHIKLRGLMCLPPVFDSGEAARPFFASLRKLRDNLAAELGTELVELSMGMSGDFEAAIAEGATIVRIGTSIFGPRPQHMPVES